MFAFCRMEKDGFETYAAGLFSILRDNMSRIAPTGNSREEDYRCWLQAMREELKDENRHVVMCLRKDTHELAGFFQYSLRGEVFFMEEMQIKEAYQGKNHIFRKIYGLVLEDMGENVEFVEAYASKRNEKSIGVLGRLGLSVIGENKNGRSYHFRGRYADLLKWYSQGNGK